MRKKHVNPLAMIPHDPQHIVESLLHLHLILQKLAARAAENVEIKFFQIEKFCKDQ